MAAHGYPPPAGYGAHPPAAYPAPGGYGHAPPAAPAAAPPGYPGAPPPESMGYSGWAPCYGSSPPAGYSAPPPGYGAPPPAAGYPPPAYPGYGAPPPAGYPPPAYPGYGAPPPGYGVPGYGALDRELRSGRDDDRDRDRDRGQRGQKRKPKTPGQVDGGRKEDGNRRGGKGEKGKGKGKGDKEQKTQSAGASAGGSQDNKPASDAKPDTSQNEGSKPQESTAVVPAGDSSKGDSKGSGKSKGPKGDGKGKGDGGCMKGKGGGKGKGKVALKISWGEPCFAGVLRKYNLEKKVGVISSAEAYSMCGGMETYAFGSVLEGAKIGVGDTFVFFVHWSKWGEPQASHELLRITAKNGMAMKGKFKKATDASGEKDFGFIDCPEAREYFQRDIYVHKDLMIGLESGQWVSFNAKLNKDMKVECTEIQGCDESWTPPPGDLNTEQEAENVGPSWDFSAIYGPRPKYDNNPKPTGEFFTAEFTSYIENRGFGFVGSDALRARFGQDLFAHHKELSKISDKVVGAKIYFELGATDDGKFQVMNAVPAASAPGAILDLPSLDASVEPPAKKQKTEETAPVETAAITSGTTAESADSAAATATPEATA